MNGLSPKVDLPSNVKWPAAVETQAALIHHLAATKAVDLIRYSCSVR
jgi:hypothetical protein